MEWIETTGRTVADAIEAALDRLGVDTEELEYEVVQEPKTGFFARLGGSEARIRARVRPISREKPDTKRRRRPERKKSGSGGGNGGGTGGANRGRRNGGGGAPAGEAAASTTTAGTSGDATGTAAADDDAGPGESAPARRRRSRGGRGRAGAATTKSEAQGDEAMHDEAAVETATAFVDGLVRAFGGQAEVQAIESDEQVVIQANGTGLGALIGPRAATLDAITELTRTVVHRTGAEGPKLVVDIAGYRDARRSALVAFVERCAATAKETGRAQALEPMNSADRKLVHDTCGEIDGVRTISEGEDARRRVVIVPE